MSESSTDQYEPAVLIRDHCPEIPDKLDQNELLYMTPIIVVVVFWATVVLSWLILSDFVRWLFVDKIYGSVRKFALYCWET